MRSLKKTLVIFLILTTVMLSSCTNSAKQVFYAFTDGFLDWYKLELYSDMKFDLHIPVSDYTGTYTISGDTIILHYDENYNEEDAAPVAYIIDKTMERIDELEMNEDGYVIKKKNNRWIKIVENNLEL